MQQKAPDKFPHRQRHELHGVAVAIVSPAKRDLAILERDQAMVTDGYPMGRATQVGDHLLSRGKGFLGIDHPGVLPQRGHEAVKGLGVSQGGGRAGTAQRSLRVGLMEAREIFPPKDLGEPFDRDEEVAALGGNPTLAIWGEGATVTIPWTWMWCSSVCPQVWSTRVRPSSPPSHLGSRPNVCKVAAALRKRRP